jgi:hypothetical protein
VTHQGIGEAGASLGQTIRVISFLAMPPPFILGRTGFAQHSR